MARRRSWCAIPVGTSSPLRSSRSLGSEEKTYSPQRHGIHGSFCGPAGGANETCERYAAWEVKKRRIHHGSTEYTEFFYRPAGSANETCEMRCHAFHSQNSENSVLPWCKRFFLAQAPMREGDRGA